MPPLPPPQPPKQRRGFLLGVLVGLVIAAALVVALLVAGGDDDGSVPTAGSEQVPASTVEGGVAPAESQPVEITGDALPQLPGAGDEDAAIGVTPPSLDGYSFDGSPVSVSPGGTAKMVVFLAHWCPHCNREVPVLIEWEESGQLPEGLEVVGVSTGVRSDADNYPPSRWLLETKGWPWPALADSADGAAGEAYGLTGFPYFVLIGDDGTVKVRFSGEIGLEQLDSLVRAALAN